MANLRYNPHSLHKRWCYIPLSGINVNHCKRREGPGWEATESVDKSSISGTVEIICFGVLVVE